MKEQAVWHVVGSDKRTGNYWLIITPAGFLTTEDAAIARAKFLATTYPSHVYLVVRATHLIQHVDVPVLVQEL